MNANINIYVLAMLNKKKQKKTNGKTRDYFHFVLMNSRKDYLQTFFSIFFIRFSLHFIEFDFFFYL